MINKINIRRATINDIDKLVSLVMMLEDYHCKLDSYYKSGKAIKNYILKDLGLDLKNKDTLIIVAEYNGQLVGYIDAGIIAAMPFVRYKKVGLIYDAYVLDKFRGNGIFRKMFSKVESWFKSRRIKILEIKVNVNNPSGFKAWKKLGFEEFVHTMHKKI